VLRTVLYAGPGPAPEGLLDLEELIAGHEPVPDVRRAGDSLSGIYYTGGTTGQPKGVMLSHANLLTSALGSAASGGFMVSGGRYPARRAHVPPRRRRRRGRAHRTRWHPCDRARFTPAGVADAIERHRVTDVLLVPTMVQLLVDSPDAAAADLSSLRNLLYGASRSPKRCWSGRPSGCRPPTSPRPTA